MAARSHEGAAPGEGGKGGCGLYITLNDSPEHVVCLALRVLIYSLMWLENPLTSCLRLSSEPPREELCYQFRNDRVKEENKDRAMRSVADFLPHQLPQRFRRPKIFPLCGGYLKGKNCVGA